MTPARRAVPRELLCLFKRLWWLKAPGSALFIWGFFEAYFFLLRYPHAQVFTMPLTWLDTAIPMQAWAWVPYLSLWFYTCLPPALLPGLRQLIYYGLSVGACCGAGLLCFYFWPTVIPDVVKPADATLALLDGIDAAGNACPSLHVAIAVFSALWLEMQLRQVGADRRWRLGNWLWCALIAYSTVATRQHVVFDVIAGTALGTLGGILSLRGFATLFPRDILTTPSLSGAPSHDPP